MTDAQNATNASTPSAGDIGPLTRKVLEYEQTMKRLIPNLEAPDEWAPLSEFVAVVEFERIGTFLEVQNWQQYTEMITRWASSTERFETTVRRISEVGRLVYYEIEERHFRAGTVHVVNSMTVFEFNSDNKICHLDVFLQQAR